MLHNVCADRWLLNNPRKFHKNRRVWPDVPDQMHIDDPMPEDEAIMNRMHNNYIHARAISHDNSIRNHLLQDIYDAGIVATSDTEFHQLD